MGNRRETVQRQGETRPMVYLCNVLAGIGKLHDICAAGRMIVWLLFAMSAIGAWKTDLQGDGFVDGMIMAVCCVCASYCMEMFHAIKVRWLLFGMMIAFAVLSGVSFILGVVEINPELLPW